MKLEERGHAAGRVRKGEGRRVEEARRWKRTQWRHGRSVKTTASASNRQSPPGVRQRRAERTSGSGAHSYRALAAQHETVGMQESLRYAGLR